MFFVYELRKTRPKGLENSGASMGSQTATMKANAFGDGGRKKIEFKANFATE